MVIKQKRIEQILKVSCDKEGIEKASQIINQGGVAIFPTDTVYGIGCNPYNKDSVRKIYEIKSRDVSKPFPVLAYSKDIAERIVFFDEFAKKIAERFWPGPLTIILKLTDKNAIVNLNNVGLPVFLNPISDIIPILSPTKNPIRLSMFSNKNSNDV